ncbi:MAG: transglycosylase SLT domain-containing protein [Polyangiaceae bacterium]
MSVLHKIPPLVSALAFGYGVGMSAPESTITSVNAAVVAYQAPTGLRPVIVAPQQVTSGSPRPAGEESRELNLMRRAADDERRGAACEIDRPLFSKSPRYESRPDAMSDDSDDLDGPGVDALSRLQMPDLKVSISRRTLKYVRFFAKTDRGRGMFETWLKRSGKYQDLIQSELRRRRLPEDLIWVSMIESGFDPRVKSPAGAVGLWQFMPTTGKVYGLDQNKFMDQRKNPRLATQAAAHHLRDLYLRFQSWDLALAAYNMGYEQLLSAIDRYGTTDFNELARQEAIPSETASYVPKIAAAAIVANNLERFGFDRVEITQPLDTAELAVPPSTPLKLLAKSCGVSTSVIRNMNPDILGDKLPPGRGDFLVQIPADSLSRARASLPSMLDNEPVETDANVLDPVDLLGGRDFKPRRADEDGSLLSLLPHPKRHSMRDQLEALGGDDDTDRDRDDDDVAPRKGRKGREVLMYRVGPGDSLVSVAKQFALDVEDVARDNKIDASDTLKAGQLLKLHVRKDAVEKSTEPSSKAPLTTQDTSKDEEPKPIHKSDRRDRSDRDEPTKHHAKSDRRARAEDASEKKSTSRSEKSEHATKSDKPKSKSKKH